MADCSHRPAIAEKGEWKGGHSRSDLVATAGRQPRGRKNFVPQMYNFCVTIASCVSSAEDRRGRWFAFPPSYPLRIGDRRDSLLPQMRKIELSYLPDSQFRFRAALDAAIPRPLPDLSPSRLRLLRERDKNLAPSTSSPEDQDYPQERRAPSLEAESERTFAIDRNGRWRPLGVCPGAIALGRSGRDIRSCPTGAGMLYAH